MGVGKYHVQPSISDGKLSVEDLNLPILTTSRRKYHGRQIENI